MPAPTLLDPSRFAGMVANRSTGLYWLENDHGMRVAICNVGGRILQIIVPDRHGRPGNVALGYDSLGAILAGSPSLGAFIAPYAGRIADAGFSLDGRHYRLAANDGPHCLHGGASGSCLRAFEVISHGRSALALGLLLPAGDTGLAGSLDIRLDYRLDDDNALVIEHLASSDGPPTPASFTSHGYFNLDLDANPTIDTQHLQVFAGQRLRISETDTVDGTRESIAGTGADLREPRLLGEIGRLDHVYDLGENLDGGLRLCARLSAHTSGRIMETWSTEPVLVVYSADHLGHPHRPRMGICLEPQQYPNAPNCPSLPLNLVSAQRPYRAITRYRFLS
ncbi:MAG: aldose epimerase family protein [Burkholderiaceae bacterium]